MSVFDPTAQPGASIVQLDASARAALGLMGRPTLNIPVPSVSVSRQLVGGVGILAGVNLRESAAVLTGIAFQSASSALAAAANNVTLPAGGAGVTTYVTGFEVTGDGATAGSIIAVTLTGILGGTATYFITIPAGAGVAITSLVVEFTSPGFPASAANTAITLNVPSFGVGNTNAAATIRGYQQQTGTALGPGQVTPSVVADLLDGLDTLGEELLPIVLPAGGLTQLLPGAHGPLFKRGVFLSMTSGTLRGSIYVKI